MINKAFNSAPVNYQGTDTSQRIYQEIRHNARAYFTSHQFSVTANRLLATKMVILVLAAVLGYGLLLAASGFGSVLAGYLLFGTALLLLSINLGHDAAHHAVTGNIRLDNGLFRLIFAIQGLSGYLWQIRHNHSHHILPNVHEHDSDLELGNLIVLDRNGTVKPFHRYQHLYAPVLYAFASLVLFFYQDYEMLARKHHGNLDIGQVPRREWWFWGMAKIVHLSLYIFLPATLGHAGLGTILGAFFLMHLLLSLFMMFTFVISHHVVEVPYVVPQHGGKIADAWVHHQVTTTIDFNEKSRLANFVFGGFNLHVAHHLFPEVSHIHYPALTTIIRQTLADNNCADWYKSFTFRKGVVSHLRHLKAVGRQQKMPRTALKVSIGKWLFSEN